MPPKTRLTRSQMRALRRAGMVRREREKSDQPSPPSDGRTIAPVLTRDQFREMLIAVDWAVWFETRAKEE